LLRGSEKVTISDLA